MLWTVRPVTGQALIFNHDTYHEGEPVIKGTKFILRTEVIITHCRRCLVHCSFEAGKALTTPIGDVPACRHRGDGES